MSTLLEKANEIKRQKDTYLLPENLKEGVTCLGVTGTLEVTPPNPNGVLRIEPLDWSGVALCDLVLTDVNGNKTRVQYNNRTKSFNVQIPKNTLLSDLYTEIKITNESEVSE